MDVRKFLYECREAAFAIRSLERQRDAVRLPNGPRNRSTSIVAGDGRDNDPTATALNNLDYYDALLEAEQNERARRLIQLEHMLGWLASDKDRAIMRYYFGQGWTHVKIACELEANEETVRRRRRAAEKILERKFSGGTKSSGMSGS